MARKAKAILAEVSADTSSGYTVIAAVPTWASAAVVHIYGDDDTDSTQSSFATKFYSCNPFADTVTISGGGSTQTTVTLTDCPTSGSWNLFATENTTSVYPLPFNADPLQVMQAVRSLHADLKDATVTRTGTGRAAGAYGLAAGAAADPYVYTINNSTATTFTAGSKLFGAVVDTATNFLDFGGTTAVTTQSTSEYAQVHIGASVSNTADPGDVTAHIYRIIGLLPAYFAVATVQDVTTDTACTYSSKIVVEYQGGG